MFGSYAPYRSHLSGLGPDARPGPPTTGSGPNSPACRPGASRAWAPACTHSPQARRGDGEGMGEGGTFPAGRAWGQSLRWTPGRGGGESAAAGGPWGSLLVQVGRKPGFEYGSISCQVVCPALQPLPSIQLIPEHPRPEDAPDRRPPPARPQASQQLGLARSSCPPSGLGTLRGRRPGAALSARWRCAPNPGSEGMTSSACGGHSGAETGEGEGEGGALGGPGTAEADLLSANLELSVSRPKATGPAGALGAGPRRAGSLRPPEPLHLPLSVPGGGVTRSSSGRSSGS